MPADRLWISVYDDDDETFALWHDEIDTGLGLERVARILQKVLRQRKPPMIWIYDNFASYTIFKVPNNYETDLVFPIIEKAAELENVSYALADYSSKTKLKIIGDHMRAVVYLISDGVNPSNIGRGYVVRRLIRRVVRIGRLLGVKGDGMDDLQGTFLPILAKKVIELSTNIDAYVKKRSSRIFE
ncbi:hypothetical protein FXO38_12687 [Capsicum annuum]|nr:hypothetical protein FXO38_12687 [Capsicum annuum]